MTSRIMLAGLIEITLPDRTLRLCDGGFVYFKGEKFASEDPLFGTIGEAEAVEESVGDDAPAWTMTFLPKSTAAATELSQPGHQNSHIRGWLVEVDPVTGIADEASAELVSDMLLDTTELIPGRDGRRLEVGMISWCERLFTINEGNTLNARFHKTIWPGELGLDNAIDVSTSVAWGVPSPPRGAVGGDGAGGGTPGGGGRFTPRNPDS